MIKINKAIGYLAGLILVFLIYLVGQLFFFFNTARVSGHICDITSKSGSFRHPGRVEIFYACFTTKENKNITFRAGSNLDYGLDDTVQVLYKKNNPHRARIDHFSELWVVPAFIYIIPFALVMGIVTAIYAGRRYVIINKKPFKISTIK
ncbi:MAG TPA: DUF3592 domain-containing protein [Chitinophagaceae bacterium]